MSACRACDAPIRWALTVNGKRIPLDRDPNPAGNVELQNDPPLRHPLAIVHAGPPGMFDDWVAFMPHHATCPSWPSR